VQSDIEEKKARLEKIKADVKAAKYEERLEEKSLKARELDDRRNALTREIRTLSSQADIRAKLDIKRTELKRKSADVKNT
jgi:DNA repair protein RAD50